MICPTCGKEYTEEDAAKDEGKVKPGCGRFSNMCAEEIKEVAIGLHANNELLPKNMILRLIGNLADVVMRLEKDFAQFKDEVFALKSIREMEVKEKECCRCQFFFGHCSMSQYSGKHGEYVNANACLFFKEKPK